MKNFKAERRVPLVSVEIYETEPPHKYCVAIIDHRTRRYEEMRASRTDLALKWAADALKELRRADATAATPAKRPSS